MRVTATRVALIGLILVAAGAGSSRASTIGVTVSGGTTFTTANAEVGWVFRVNQALSISALGMWDSGSDGLVGTDPVGLWTVGGTLLAETDVTSADPLTDGFRFHSIAPVPLTVGEQYIVAGLLNGFDTYRYDGFVTDSSGITWIDSRAETTSTFVFPTEYSGRSGSWFGANVLYDVTPTAVPEPASMLLLGTGLVGVGARRWRNRRQRG